MEHLEYLESVRAVLGIVTPEFDQIRREGSIIGKFVLPVDIVLAVHGGKKSEILGDAWEADVLRKHSVKVSFWAESPGSDNMLCIIREMLAADAYIGMGEELA